MTLPASDVLAHLSGSRCWPCCRFVVFPNDGVDGETCERIATLHGLHVLCSKFVLFRLNRRGAAVDAQPLALQLPGQQLGSGSHYMTAEKGCSPLVIFLAWYSFELVA